MMTAWSGSGPLREEVVLTDFDPTHESLTELERRSLLAEQAREQAHRLRSPLNVIELVSETLQLELGEDRGRAERIQRMLDAVSTLSMNLTQNARSMSPRWPQMSSCHSVAAWMTSCRRI